MALRSTLVAALAIAAGLALVAVSGSVVSRAHAQVTTDSIFYGFISPHSDDTLPQKVRATVADVTCGTADVTPLENGLGFYLIAVASFDMKVGCGVEGAPVTFLFLDGEIDSGSPAAQTQAWRVGTQRLDLSVVPDATFGTFAGELPAGPGIGFMRWTGASAMPTWQAIATIPREVVSVSYLNAATQGFLVYIPGAPAAVSTYLLVDRDDIVIVRVR